MGWGCELRYRPKTQPAVDAEPTAKVGDDPRDLCPKTPFGWLCTRKPGHEGPCAAVRTSDTSRQRLATRGDVLDSEQRLAELIRANARADSV